MFYLNLKYDRGKKYFCLFLNYRFRYQAGDFSGQLLAEVSAIKHPRPYIPVNSNQVVIKQDTRVTKSKVSFNFSFDICKL